MVYREENLFAIKICFTIAAKTYFTTRLFPAINLPNVTVAFFFFYFCHNFEGAYSPVCTHPASLFITFTSLPVILNSIVTTNPTSYYVLFDFKIP